MYASGISGVENLVVGNEVEVSGVVIEFYGLTEIEADTVTIISETNRTLYYIGISRSLDRAYIFANKKNYNRKKGKNIV